MSVKYGYVFMFARKQMKALHTHVLVSGIMFYIICVRLCCNNWSQNNAIDYCQSDYFRNARVLLSGQLFLINFFSL